MNAGDNQEVIGMGSDVASKSISVFVGQADFRTPLDRAKLAILPDDVDSVTPEDQALHTQALEAFASMESDPEAVTLLTKYCETMESADFQLMASSLGQIQDLEQAAEVVKGNFFPQIDKFFMGASEIRLHGRAVVQRFGVVTTFHSIEEIVHELEVIRGDMQGIHALILESIDEKTLLDPSVLMRRLEKFMFEGKKLEKERGKSVSTLIIRRDEESGFIDMLKREQIIEKDTQVLDATHQKVQFHDGDVATIGFPTYASREGLSSRIDMTNEGDRETGNIFLAMGDIPQTVIIHVPSNNSFSSKKKGDHYAYQYLFIDWFRLPYKDRPQVIMYTDGFQPPLYIKHSYQGFLFCSTPDELRNVVTLSNQLAQDQASEIYSPELLSIGQKEAYDNSDLREWENKTADTFQSLNHLISRFNYRNDLYKQYRTDRYSRLTTTDESGNTKWHTAEEDSETPTRRIRTILDLGTGEGRIAGTLARLGYNVMGLDISEKQIARSRERIREEGEGLRGEKDHPGLSYHALLRLQELGLVPPPSTV